MTTEQSTTGLENKENTSPYQSLPGDAGQETKSHVHWLRQQVTRIYDAVQYRIDMFVARFKERFKTLNFSQWCYLLAILMLLAFLSEDQPDDDYQIVVGLIAGFGLLRELWKVFTKVWEHTLGKGVLFVLYAATANFALAISALKINSITGVEPQIFIFTMGFTTLLMLPFWLLLASVLFLGTALLIMNFWLLLSLLLRLVRIKLPIHWEDRSFAILTMLVRVVLIPFLLIVLAYLMEPYIKQLDMFEPIQDLSLVKRMRPNIIDSEKFENASEAEIRAFVAQLRSSQSDEQRVLLEEQITGYNLTGLEVELISEMSDSTVERFIKRVAAQEAELSVLIESDTDALPLNGNDTSNNKEITADLQAADGLLDSDPNAQSESSNNDRETNEVTFGFRRDSDDDNQDGDDKSERVLDLMVANFIYVFETYPYSACQKKPDQRALKFDENLVFVAEKDESKDLGYRFFVAPCEPATPR